MRRSVETLNFERRNVRDFCPSHSLGRSIIVLRALFGEMIKFNDLFLSHNANVQLKFRLWVSGTRCRFLLVSICYSFGAVDPHHRCCLRTKQQPDETCKFAFYNFHRFQATEERKKPKVDSMHSVHLMDVQCNIFQHHVRDISKSLCAIENARKNRRASFPFASFPNLRTHLLNGILRKWCAIKSQNISKAIFKSRSFIEFEKTFCNVHFDNFVDAIGW